MVPFPDGTPPPRDREPEFHTTRWSVVLAVGDGQSDESSQALEILCRTYWFPLYAYVRRWGQPPADAEDLTQAFLARMLEKRSLGLADPARGRFRTFLLCAFKRFLADEWDKSNTAKRGRRLTSFSLDELDPEARYAIEPVDSRSADALYDRQWAQSMLREVLARLQQEWTAEGRQDAFETLKVYLVGNKGDQPFATAAQRLGMTESAVKSVVHRLRLRYRDLVRAVVVETVQDPGDVDREIRELLVALAT
ncbi:MAG: sigma-70 family RNA polymerase sigma factor [Verrucomicrobiales bacterium]|nr:sigma-70 family RNA polymerase sigma factor [Verrucomicrobiales bacterium]